MFYERPVGAKPLLQKPAELFERACGATTHRCPVPATWRDDHAAEQNRRVPLVLTLIRRSIAALTLALLWPSPGYADDGLSLSCAVCHGTPQVPSRVPDFYDWDAARISDRLREFRSGARAGTAMPRLALSLSDAEIDALALRFGSAAP